MKKSKIPLLIAIALCIGSVAPGFAQTFDLAVVFGDSLSDNGNLFEIDLELVPDPAFYNQGRFSNGPVWVEYLTAADLLNAPLDDRALGGATTDGHAPPGLLDQVALYTLTTSAPSPQTLFIIWIGANDFLNNGANPISSARDVISAMSTLADYGARQILVGNLPNLGAIPDTLGTPESQEGTLFTLNFNAELAAGIASFEQSHPQVTVFLFDTYALFEQLRSNPAAFGFSNVTEPSPNQAIAGNFDNSAGYLFWDDRHPTTEAHAVIADRAFTVLTDQPLMPGATEGSAGSDSSDNSCFVAAAGLGTSGSPAGPRRAVGAMESIQKMAPLIAAFAISLKKYLP